MIEPIFTCVSKVYYLIPRKYSTFLRSILMRLYSPVDLTGNMNMIEKLVLGGDWNRGPPDHQPDALTSAPSSHGRLPYFVCCPG